MEEISLCMECKQVMNGKSACILTLLIKVLRECVIEEEVNGNRSLQSSDDLMNDLHFAFPVCQDLREVRVRNGCCFWRQQLSDSCIAS